MKPLTKKSTNTKIKAEVCYVLLGEFHDGHLRAKMTWRRRGSHSAVQFDWTKVMEREEKFGDVVGFFHTHPDGFLEPSEQDKSTMRAWTFSFGKPLICAIDTSAGLRAWLFHIEGMAQEFSSIQVETRNRLSGQITIM